MIELIKQKALEYDIKIAIIPVDCILDVKADMEKLIKENVLIRRLKWIDEEKYTFKSAQFNPQSIIIAIRKLNLARVTFNYSDNKKSCIVEDSYHPAIKMQGLLKELFLTAGISLEYIGWAPHKNIAVRSGLCEYGRNNITYSDDWGSFIRIETYISDAPFGNHIWRNMVNMSLCNTCKKCIANCPTKAILPNRFLIDSKLCLSRLDCDGIDMPDWVPKPAPLRFLDCLICQEICPKNQERLKNVQHIEFNKKETEIMLNSNSYSDFPDSIKSKLWHYNNGESYKCIPRNLKLLLVNN